MNFDNLIDINALHVHIFLIDISLELHDKIIQKLGQFCLQFTRKEMIYIFKELKILERQEQT